MISGELNAAANSAFNFLMMAGGVPAGANTPYQDSTSNPGKVSATVGRSGNRLKRLALVTASARRRPLRTCGNTGGMLEKRICTCPASNSVVAGPDPLYGMCTIFISAI